jgi:hypothetical protein
MGGLRRSVDNMAGQAREIVLDGEIAVSDNRGVTTGRTPSPSTGGIRARKATRLARPRVGAFRKPVTRR